MGTNDLRAPVLPLLAPRQTCPNLDEQTVNIPEEGNSNQEEGNVSSRNGTGSGEEQTTAQVAIVSALPEGDNKNHKDGEKNSEDGTGPQNTNSTPPEEESQDSSEHQEEAFVAASETNSVTETNNSPAKNPTNWPTPEEFKKRPPQYTKKTKSSLPDPEGYKNRQTRRQSPRNGNDKSYRDIDESDIIK